MNRLEAEKLAYTALLDYLENCKGIARGQRRRYLFGERAIIKGWLCAQRGVPANENPYTKPKARAYRQKWESGYTQFVEWVTRDDNAEIRRAFGWDVLPGDKQ